MFTQHTLKDHQKALPARLETIQGRELLSRTIAVLNNFEGQTDLRFDKVSDEVSDKEVKRGPGLQ